MTPQEIGATFLSSVRECIARGEHPAVSPAHHKTLVRLAAGLPSAWPGDPRAASWSAWVKEIAAGAGDAAALHAALGYAWVPEYALRLAGLIDDVRFELGQRASNVVSETEDEGYLPGDLAERGLFSVLKGIGDAVDSAGAEGKFRRVEKLQLADFDFVESATVRSATPDEVVFVCARCGVAMTRRIDRAGQRDVCGCGAAVAVPVPSLQRVHVVAKQWEEERRGIRRCRMCNQVVQPKKGPVERAGFCSRLCARDGEDRFHEYVPDGGQARGREIVFACKCGASIAASTADEGSLVACLGCELQVWVPPPARDDRRALPVACPKCGRKNRATLKVCQFCSTPMA
jgi:hypothetical protein